MIKMCILWEDCQSFSNGTKRRGHHIRKTEPCVYWNGEYCTDEIVGAKPGDACSLDKRRKIKGEK